jgi:phosphatidylserine/phosphatidylglycerophosphate/cardiolipin synthase-like enzyme
MAEITRAYAFSNNEVAFLAWEINARSIEGCLGFHIVREILDGDQVIEAKPLASYVAFTGQSNPGWVAQNTSVWPIQKFTWRDLTLRRRRDGAGLRPENQTVRYCIRAVGKFQDHLEPVIVVPESHRDKKTHKVIQHTYQGDPIPLGFLTPAVYTNTIKVSKDLPPFATTFTNGILSTQFLLNVLLEDGVAEDGELEKHLRKPHDWLREYLAGDVLPLMRDFFQPADCSFVAALYELEDIELLKLLVDNAQRLSLILSDAGSESSDEDGDGANTTTYDSRNAKARKALRAIAKKPGSKLLLDDRMFNGTGHIGHNKFVVRLDANHQPVAVLTGSTNWTYSGIAGQSNNCIVINEPAIAGHYLAYWNRLRDDKQPTPKPLSARNTGASQGDALKTANRQSQTVQVGAAGIETWFSPNVPGKKQPPSASASSPPAPPPDVAHLFSLMRKAKRAIFFLVFMPSRGGLNSIVSEAVALGEKDPSLLVTGAISDSQAMWKYEAANAAQGTKSYSPHVYQSRGVSVIRATALADRELLKELGDFKLAEKLTVGRAIIHDKILVVDPLDPDNCVVAFGSHNLGYKASYSNDENLVIVRGHQALALAYTAHVLDVYDHYRFRALEIAKRVDKINGRRPKKWSGFLDATPGWQDKASHRLSRYFARQ